MIGEKILNYKIEKLIGEGGMGTVYLGINEQFEQKVAIKVLAPQFVHNADIVKRFKKEASMLSKLNHPNIVKLLNFYENDKGVYLIMEYVEGYTLDEYITNISGPILEDKAAEMFYEILDGFEFAHSKGIIHRDIKPSNIIVTNDGEIKIFDFGIAKLINEPENQKLTRTGTKLGTVVYMSPEQIRQGEVSKLSDIYSLGVVLHQLLTGKSPYMPNEMSEFDISTKIVFEPLPRLKSIYPHVSDEIQNIVDIASSKKPENRFSSCSNFKSELWGLYNENNYNSKKHISNISERVKPDSFDENNKIHIILLKLFKNELISKELFTKSITNLDNDKYFSQIKRIDDTMNEVLLLSKKGILSNGDFEHEKKLIKDTIINLINEPVLDNSENTKQKNDIIDSELKLISELHRLINKSKISFWGNLNSNLISFMETNFISKEVTLTIMEKYKVKYGEDLVTSLMGISNYYDKIRSYLSVLIKLKIVRIDYPHQLK